MGVKSYEVGVCVWPGLFADGGAEAEMVPVFGGDGGGGEGVEGKEEGEGVKGKEGGVKTRVAWRMAYDVPLRAYGAEEKPWCASERYEEVDWMGRMWAGY